MRGQVAKKLKITTRTLARWERGDTEPSFAQVEHLAKIYGVPFASLIAGDRAA